MPFTYTKKKTSENTVPNTLSSFVFFLLSTDFIFHLFTSYIYYIAEYTYRNIKMYERRKKKSLQQKNGFTIWQPEKMIGKANEYIQFFFWCVVGACLLTNCDNDRGTSKYKRHWEKQHHHIISYAQKKGDDDRKKSVNFYQVNYNICTFSVLNTSTRVPEFFDCFITPGNWIKYSNYFYTKKSKDLFWLITESCFG